MTQETSIAAALPEIPVRRVKVEAVGPDRPTVEVVSAAPPVPVTASSPAPSAPPAVPVTAPSPEPQKPVPVTSEVPAPAPLPAAPPVAAQAPVAVPVPAAASTPPAAPASIPAAATLQPWETELERSAASLGVSAGFLRKVVQAESGGNPSAAASTSSSRGLFGFTDETWTDIATRNPSMAITDRNDPVQQSRAAAIRGREIVENLKRKLGREPTEGEGYLGWFLGPTGSAMVVDADPATPLDRVVSPRALAANPAVFANPKRPMRTVEDLQRWAAGKMGGAYEPPALKVDLVEYLNKDPFGLKSREHVEGLTYTFKARLANMIADMPEELRKDIRINSGFRSPARQAQLLADSIGQNLGPEARSQWEDEVKAKGPEAAGAEWAERLRGAGITRMIGLPGRSNHQHGTAADLNISAPGPLRSWVHANAGKYGLAFPMSHEPWHIEAADARTIRTAAQAVRYGDNSPRQPITFEDERATKEAREARSYGIVRAGIEAFKQESALSWMLETQSKAPYDPAFRVTAADLLKDPRLSTLPPTYFPHLAEATSAQDLAFRIDRSRQDFDIESRLAATPYSTPLRMAAAFADPAGILISATMPFVGLTAKAGRIGRIAGLAADGAAGAVLTELPIVASKPSAELSQLLWAGALGSGTYVALNRFGARAPHVADEAEAFVQKTEAMRADLEAGTFGASSAGAAQNILREAVRGDIDDFLALDTAKTAFGPLRFDFAKMKNSDNPVVAALTDRLGLDTVGNRDKSIPVTRPLEYDKRKLDDRAQVAFSRDYVVAAADYRERNGIGAMEWKLGREDAFQREVGRAVRNTDPLAEIDPSVSKLITAWGNVRTYFRENAQNPGKLDGTTLRPIAGAEHWADDPTWLPRFVNWDSWRSVTMTFGDLQVKRLLSEAIARKNPDLDRDLAHKVGGWYYERLRRVEAGQELTGQRMFSGVDVEAMRRSLTDELGLDAEQVGRVLFRATVRDDAKGLTARQKPRTHMDEGFSLRLTGKDPSTGASVSRDVSVSELWEDNINAVMGAYASQMSGTIAMARLQVKNPRFRAGDDPATEFLIDGVRSRGDWDKVITQARPTAVRLGFKPMRMSPGLCFGQPAFRVREGRGDVAGA